MNNALSLLLLLLQLLLAGAAFIWTLAFLGFADDATGRGNRATPLGRLLITVCVLVAAAPVLLTLAVGWCRYLPARCFVTLPLGLFLPLAATLISGLLCAGLIYLVKSFGYGRSR